MPASRHIRESASYQLAGNIPDVRAYRTECVDTPRASHMAPVPMWLVI